jgi:hypothetical protein
MPNVLINPVLFDVLNVLHVNGIKYVDSHRLIATIYKYQSIELAILLSSQVLIVLPINRIS